MFLEVLSAFYVSKTDISLISNKVFFSQTYF